MKRVVVTGMGIVAPGGVGLEAFADTIRSGKSAIRKLPFLEDHGFRSTVGGIPPTEEKHFKTYFDDLDLRRITADGIRYGCLAGLMAWEDAGLKGKNERGVDWDAGCYFGAGMPGADEVAKAVRNVDAGRVKRLGSTTVLNTMSSGVSAHLGGFLGLGNHVSSNSTACATGTEAILMGYNHIKSGRAKRMLCGACDSAGLMVRSGFDAMRVLSDRFNDMPEKASRPMSASASGFVASGGAGALLLEDLESALERGVDVYGEILGGHINAGGQMNGGSMTAPSAEGVQRCIRGALDHALISPAQVDAISGHLTATAYDPVEIRHWVNTLQRNGKSFPKINSLKSICGHCLSAAGAIETVACFIQLNQKFLHPSLNCEDLHPVIADMIEDSCIPRKAEHFDGNIMLNASFGFGDVNCCLVLANFE
jgi:3-oxoacyl-(acyl-carrier-protein) synthase